MKLRVTLAVVAFLSVTACGGLLGPAATPYAPDDLAFTMPPEVRGTEMTIAAATAEEFLSDAAREALRVFLVANGKGLTDFLGATAVSDGADDPITIAAMRIRGIGADRLMSLFVGIASPPPSLVPVSINGRSAIQLAGIDPTAFGYLYGKGEVLYLISTRSQADAEAALMALP